MPGPRADFTLLRVALAAMNRYCPFAFSGRCDTGLQCSSLQCSKQAATGAPWLASQIRARGVLQPPLGPVLLGPHLPRHAEQLPGDLGAVQEDNAAWEAYWGQVRGSAVQFNTVQSNTVCCSRC